MTQKPSLLKADEIRRLPESANVHQFNDKALRMTRSLGDLVGLTDMGFHLVRVPPGHDTTQHHNHEFTDEFVYILSGRGKALINDQEYDIGAGDFMGFPKCGAAHSMSNPYDEDLVYLMGGNRVDIDVCNYPLIDRRMYLIKGEREYVDLPNLHKVNPK